MTGKLYNKDFRSILRLLDTEKTIVVSDPPYNIGFNYGSYEDKKSRVSYVKMIAELSQFPAVLIGYPEQVFNLYAPGMGRAPDRCLAWCYNSNLARNFRLISLWDLVPDFRRVIQPYKNPKDKRVARLMLSGKTGAKSYDWFSDINIVKNVSKEKTIHPCPIPEKLIERILLLINPQGKTIFDPFCGGGTVPAVAKRMGFDCVGCEIDTKYYSVAVGRVRGGKMGQ